MRKSLFVFGFFFTFSFLFCFSSDRNFIGDWKIISSKDENRNSVISIFKSDDGKYYGKITKLLTTPGALCNACVGDEKDKPIEGMIILKSLEFSSGELVNGTILDPSNAQVYYCRIEYNEKRTALKVKISLDKKGRLSKTEYWSRY